VPAEVERKFIVNRPPDAIQQFESTRIEQAYLFSDDRLEVRIRRSAGRSVLTIKSGGGLRRAEVEVALTEEAADELWPITEGMRLVKRRYEIPHTAGLVQVDIYEGSLQGLIVAEVEFESETDAGDYVPPEWFDDEVTDDGRYRNYSLAKAGVPT
jgi:adenylate cyclase